MKCLQHFFSKLRFIFIRDNASNILSFIRFVNFVLVKVTVEKIRSTTAFEIGIIKQDNAYIATLSKALSPAAFLYFLTPIQNSTVSEGILPENS